MRQHNWDQAGAVRGIDIRRGEHGIISRYGLPVGSAGGGFRQAPLTIILASAALAPLLYGEKLAVSRVIGRGHETALAIDPPQRAVRFETQVIVRQEKQVVGQFVRQSALPVLAEIRRALAEGIPTRPHPHLSRPIRLLHNRCAVSQRLRYRLAHDAANRRRGPNAVVGQDHDVHVVPIVPVVEHTHIADGRLPVSHIKEDLGGALDVRGQVQQE